MRSRIEKTLHWLLPNARVRALVQLVIFGVFTLPARATAKLFHCRYIPVAHRVADRFYRLADYNAAAEVYLYHISRHPEDFLARYNCGRALSKLGREREAIENFKAACELCPTSVSAWYELGKNYQRLSNHAEALTAFETAFQLRPEHGAAVEGYVEELLHAGNYSQALQIIKCAFLNLHSERRGEHLTLLAEVALASGDLELALLSVEEFLSTDPNNPYGLLALAKLLKANRRTSDAHRLCKRILLERLERIENDSSQLRIVSDLSLFDLGRALQKLGFDDLAVIAFEEALPDPLDSEYVHFTFEILRDCGRSLNRLKRPDDALGMLTRALSYRVDSRVVREISKSYAALGQLSDALKVLSEYSATYPEDASIWYESARILYNFGRYSAAKDAILQAQVLDSQDAEIARLKGIIEGNLRVYTGGNYPEISYSFPFRGTAGKILHLLETSLPHKRSGYTYRSHYVVSAQKQMGFNPLVVTRCGFPEELGTDWSNSPESIDEIPYHRIPGINGLGYTQSPLDQWLQRYSEQVFRLALDERPELLHAVSNFKNGLVARAVSRALKIPFVYELRGIWEDTQVSKGILDPTTDRYIFFRAMETECVNTADAVVTISETLREEISGRGVAPEKIFVVPNAVEVEKFPVVTRDVELAEALKLGPGPVFGYISSFVAYEGIDVLIKAFALIRQTLPAAKLLLVGDGDETSTLKKLSSDLGLAESVIFTGRVDHGEIVRYYSLIDLFVVPRLPLRVCEIVTPLKPYEAMSTGRALIVSNVKALREMVREGETGVYFEAGDPQSLAAVGIKLANSPEKRLELGTNAARWVREHRTWKSVTRAYRDAYYFAKDTASSVVPASQKG